MFNFPMMVEVAIGRSRSTEDGIARIVMLPAVQVENCMGDQRLAVITPKYPNGIISGCYLGGHLWLPSDVMTKLERVCVGHCDCCDQGIYEMMTESDKKAFFGEEDSWD